MEGAKMLAIFILVFGLVISAFAEFPEVTVELSRGNWVHVDGNNIDNNSLPYSCQWMLLMDVTSANTVTSPYIDFNSPRSFVAFDRYPTSIVPPSTYVWDYPDRSLTYGQGPFSIDVEEGGVVATPGFTAVRSVDNPILLNDVSTQTLSFTIRFEELSPDINHVAVDLGTFPWRQYVVEETVLSANSVPGWSYHGDGVWVIHPNNITIGSDYNFQAQIQCTKKPEYQGTAVFHKPQAFVITAELYNLAGEAGSSTFVMHPEGETATFDVNESVVWTRNTSLNRQDVFLDMVSVPIDDTGLAVNAIEIYYGKEYDGDGTYLGHSFYIEAESKNIVLAEVTTPGGRTWAMEVDEDGEIEWEAAYFSTGELAALGVVSGTYDFAFHGPLGGTITTSVNMTLVTPTQVPNITYPEHRAEDVDADVTVNWDNVWDTSIDTIMVFMEDDEEDWGFETELPADQNCSPAVAAPVNSGIYCYLVFDDTQSGETAEGIEWATNGFTLQRIHFTTGSFSCDLDGDKDVDFVDFAVLASAWSTQTGDLWWNPDCDISDPNDSIIDEHDLDVCTESWLVGL